MGSRYAQGGLIPGPPDRDSDTVPAFLSPGYVVVTRRARAIAGDRLLAALNGNPDTVVLSVEDIEWDDDSDPQRSSP